MRRHLPLALLITSLALASCRTPGSSVVAQGQLPAAPDRSGLPEDQITAAELERHIRFLASDELRGRRAGTREADIAARYIAEHFRAAGVRPAPGSQDFFQAVPLPRVGPGAVSYNVVGVIEGSDPALRNEYVALLAHYDHVGAGMRNGPGATAADSIFNGARDNAMGTAAVLAAAKALAAERPARSVILLAVTAEEGGIIGSQFYAENPLIPLNQTVYALNIDTGGYSDTSIVTVVGLGRTTADPLIRQGAAAYGLEVISDPAPEQNLFDRSDNVRLAAKGIPAPTFSPGFRSFEDPGVANYYHRPNDEPDDLDYAYLRRFALAYVRAARLIADSPTRPTWTAGDKYEAAARALYGR